MNRRYYNVGSLQVAYRRRDPGLSLVREGDLLPEVAFPVTGDHQIKIRVRQWEA